MPQVSLYIDKELYKEVESIVKKKDVSMSSFVSNVLKEYLDNTWPEEFFELGGIWNDDPIDIPKDAPLSSDPDTEPW